MQIHPQAPDSELRSFLRTYYELKDNSIRVPVLKVEEIQANQKEVALIRNQPGGMDLRASRTAAILDKT